DWIADNPWEFAYDPDRKTFLAVEEVNFVRNALTAIPADRIPKSKRLRILVVVAQPLGTAHLSVEEEEEAIKAGFRRLIDDGLAEVDILQNAAPARLHRVLEAGERYDVIHFIGHGTFENGAGYLVFEDEQQRMQKLEADVFRQIVCRRDVRLVFLNACETGQGGVADFNRGLAPALIAGGVPAVVANQYSVLDISATAFARHFYWSLAQGRSLGDAATEARIAVNYAIAGEAIDWAIPVVYARNPAEALCEPRAAADVKDDARKAVLRARRAPPSGKIRVALWDVHRMIPSLPQIAEAMTGSQERFAFEPVSIAAPMGTWRREKSKESGEVAYLRAEKVAQRLEGKPAEVGVQRLICLTNRPLRDRDTLELYGWEDAGEQIAIFSMFGFIDQLRPPELTMQRMIANGAAGFLAGLSCHKRGRKFCPLYYNDERDIRAVAGALKLCPACQKTLRADRGLREAIEKLLLL
ncbi:MAG: CHAT domain-containing protein, partial [Acidobacteria bacterium]|nr:CHAT domain-containing protein [Acidobacteriota bacterium]